ncbi:HEAT repeat protein [Ancylostoma caninum]|uniref:HEAT repeat protein n=1 Tax=Ancylostoma caninum TaxID=29170 RepID=A0A368FVA2_ANCCA|nr:HEAT repeat protein [Ancylostoma caninum]
MSHGTFLVSAAAWLETLVDVAERVSLESVKQYIVPVVQQQAEPAQRVQRRIIATKLLHKLADILPSNEVRKELGPCAQILCQDSNSNVRTSMAQRLPVIARALKNSSDAVSLLLPCFVQLYQDDDVTVKEACMNNIAQCIPHFTNEAKKTTVFPLIKKSTEYSLEKKDDTLMVIAKNFGEW